LTNPYLELFLFKLKFDQKLDLLTYFIQEHQRNLRRETTEEEEVVIAIENESSVGAFSPSPYYDDYEEMEAMLHMCMRVPEQNVLSPIPWMSNPIHFDPSELLPSVTLIHLGILFTSSVTLTRVQGKGG